MTAPIVPARRISSGEEQSSAPSRGFITRADFAGAVAFAQLTAGVIGAVLVLYGLGFLLGHTFIYLGGLLFAAATGAS